MATVRELVTVIRYKVKGNQQLKQFDRNLKQTTRTARQAETQMASLATGVKRLLGAYLGFRGIKGTFTAAQDFAELEQQVRAATQGAAQFQTVFRALKQQAKSTDSTLSAMVPSFVKLQSALSSVGASTQDVLQANEALQASLTISGTDVGARRTFMTRFGQALQKGALDGSAFNSMLRNNAQLQQYLVKGLQRTAPELGVTADNIRRLADEGKLTTDIVLPALASELSDLRKSAAQVPVDVGSAMARLRESFGELASTVLVKSGFTAKLAGGIDWVSNHLKTSIGSAGVFLSSIFGEQIVKSLGRVVGLVRKIPIALRGLRVLLNPIVAVFAAVVVSAQDVYSWLTGANSVLGKVVGRVGEWSDKLGPIKDAAQHIWHDLQVIGGGIASIVADTGQWLSDVMELPEQFAELQDAVKAGFGHLLDGIATTLNGIAATLDRAISTAKSLKHWVSNIPTDITSYITGGFGKLWDMVPFVGGGSTTTTNNSTSNADNSMHNSHNSNSTVINNYGVANPSLGGWNSAYGVEAQP